VYIHGVVAAIVGPADKPKLVCNFIKKKNGHEEEPESLEGKSFTTDFHDPKSIQDATRRFVTTLFEVIDLQAKESELENKVIPVILGQDGRQKYNFETIISNAFQAFSEVFKNSKRDLEKVLGKISIRLGEYYVGNYQADGSLKEVALDDYAKSIISPLNQGVYGERNKVLRAIRPQIEAGNESAIKHAADIAFEFASEKAMLAVLRKEMDNRFVLIYLPHPLINDMPLLNFVNWHPKIKAAFRAGYAKGISSDMQVVVKGINHKSSPPFVDIVSCYIQDAFQGIGNLQSADYKAMVQEYITKLKEHIIKPGT